MFKRFEPTKKVRESFVSVLNGQIRMSRKFVDDNHIRDKGYRYALLVEDFPRGRVGFRLLVDEQEGAKKISKDTYNHTFAFSSCEFTRKYGLDGRKLYPGKDIFYDKEEEVWYIVGGEK